MNGIAALSEKLRAIYGRYSTYIDMVWKFLLAFASFFWIRSVIGYQEIFSNPFLLVILALICVIFPLGSIPLISGVLIIGQSFGMGLDAGAIALVVMLILYCLFLRFVPDDAVGMILLPLTMYFGFGLLVPMVMGLKRRASSIFVVISGVVVYYFMANLSRESAHLSTTELTEYNVRLEALIGGTFSSTMVVMTLAMAAAFLTVYSVRKLDFNYSRIVSVIAGAVIYILFVFMGNAVVGTEISPASALLSAAASAIAALVIEVILRPLDYTKKETLEFEDDDYYYYVKAIPKASVSKNAQSKAEAVQDAEEEDLARPDLDNINFEERLEDSLKNL